MRCHGKTKSSQPILPKSRLPPRNARVEPVRTRTGSARTGSRTSSPGSRVDSPNRASVNSPEKANWEGAFPTVNEEGADELKYETKDAEEFSTEAALGELKPMCVDLVLFYS